MGTRELNHCVLKVTKNEIELPNSGNLEDAEFVYKSWKITDANNSNAKVIGIGEKRGKYKYELMRRICALGNAGGGMLFWGINEDTYEIEGMALSKEEREEIPKYMRLWTDDFNGRLYIRKKFLEVREDPFNPSDAKELYVMRIKVYPETEEEMLFSLKLRQNKKVVKE